MYNFQEDTIKGRDMSYFRILLSFMLVGAAEATWAI